MELISHIHANATFSSNQQNNSLENLASKQRIFRIVKEQHGFLSDRAIGRLLSGLLAEAKGNLDIALVRVLAGWRRPVGAGGASRDRTGDLLLAKQALSQLSYGPSRMVGLGGVAPPTSPLSGVRSN